MLGLGDTVDSGQGTAPRDPEGTPVHTHLPKPTGGAAQRANLMATANFGSQGPSAALAHSWDGEVLWGALRSLGATESRA